MLTLFGSKLTPIRKLLLMKMVSGGGSIVEETVTGNPLAFLTDLARPLKSVLATWQPHQSGSGDPSPENVRPVLGMDGVTVWHCGKNLFDGQFPNIVSAPLYYRPIYVGDDKVTVSSNVVKTTISSYSNLFALAGNVSTGAATGLNDVRDGVSRTITPVDGYITLAYRNFEDVDPRDYNTQIELGETATAYEPYHGTSYSVAFPVLGKNLLDPSHATASGNNVRYYRSGKDFLLKGGQTYTLTANVTSDQLSIFDSNNASLASTYSQSLTYTPTEDVNVWLDLYVANAHLPEGGISAVYGMLELGDTAHSYEPYTRTCYGGSLDLTTGVLTAEWAYHLYTGSSDENWNTESITAGRNFYIWTPTEWKRNTSADELMCNLAKPDTGVSSGSARISATGNLNVCIGSIIGVSTVDAFKEWLSEHNLQIAVMLKTPITFQLSPTQISALIGNNTMWADADDLSVTYLKKG